VRWYRKAVDRLIAGPHTLREGRELYAYAGFLSELLAWLAFELGNLDTAEAYAVDAWHQGWQAGHDELCAWVTDVQAGIALRKNQPSQALAAALQGIQHAPAGHPVAVRLAAQLLRAYARLGQREDFDAALRESMNLYERLPAQPLTRFGLDTGLTVSCAVTSYAASSCNSLDLPDQAQRHATDALDLLNAAPEKDRFPAREAFARIELALALVPLGSPDEACDLGHQALSSDRGVVYTVRAKSLELDAALRQRYPDLPEAMEFHERCRMLIRPSPSDGVT
jgi:tetratricopeptide (TPR) repeat protein